MLKVSQTRPKNHHKNIQDTSACHEHNARRTRVIAIIELKIQILQVKVCKCGCSGIMQFVELK